MSLASPPLEIHALEVVLEEGSPLCAGTPCEGPPHMVTGNLLTGAGASEEASELLVNDILLMFLMVECQECQECVECVESVESVESEESVLVRGRVALSFSFCSEADRCARSDLLVRVNMPGQFFFVRRSEHGD